MGAGGVGDTGDVRAGLSPEALREMAGLCDIGMRGASFYCFEHHAYSVESGPCPEMVQVVGGIVRRELDRTRARVEAALRLVAPDHLTPVGARQIRMALG